MTSTKENQTPAPKAAEATRSSILCVGEGSEEAPFDSVEPRDGDGDDDIEALAPSSSSSSNGGGSRNNILAKNKNDINADAAINCSPYGVKDEIDTDDEVSFHSDDVTVRRGRPSFNSSGTRSRSQQHQQQLQQQQQQQPSAFTPSSWRSRFGIIDDPYGEDITSDDPNDNRQSHLCCVFCCDLVRAVIIVDCIDIIVAIIIVVISLTGHEQVFLDAINFSVFSPIPDTMDDDQVVAGILEDRRVFAVVTVLTGLGVLFSALGILGACKLNRYLVLLAGIWFCVDVVRALVTLQWANAIIAALFAYPHVALFWALKKGTITRANYAETEQHCCCHCGESKQPLCD